MERHYFPRVVCMSCYFWSNMSMVFSMFFSHPNPQKKAMEIPGALVKDRWLIQLQQLFAEMDASRVRKELITATEMAALIRAASTNGAVVFWGEN